MSKTKKDSLGHYEILFIVPNKFTEDEVKKVISNVKEMIEAESGSITHEEYWGKKKLAYKIKQNEYGYYALYEFDLEGARLAQLNKNLRLANDVLRHQIVSSRVKTSEEIKKEEEIRIKIESKKAQKEKENEEKEVKVEEKKEEKKASTVKKTTADKKDESNTKDLDEKLEGILNADDLI